MIIINIMLRLIMISRFSHQRSQLAFAKTIELANRRLFATSSNVKETPGRHGGEDFEIFEDYSIYTPVRKVDFTSGKTTVFHEERKPSQPRYIPYEIKQTTLKSFLSILGLNILDFYLRPNPLFYSVATAGVCVNWFYRFYTYMANAITKMELHDDGKTVTITFKTGGS